MKRETTMITQHKLSGSSKLLSVLSVAVVLLVTAGVGQRVLRASAASCVPPTTDYGTVSNLSVSIPSTATYRIWTRMAAADTTNNTYLLELDGSTCYTVGGSTVPTYASGATTYFSNNTSNWISKTSAGSQIDVSLSAGTHTLKLIGNAPGVVVDRLVLTQDTTCVPTGTGDNCANPADTTPPVVNITTPAANASLTTTTTVTAAATDDTLVSKVEFYVDGVLKATDTASPYTFSLNPSTLSTGSHALSAKAYDTAGNTATSAIVTVTVPSGGSTTPTYLAADINQDGVVNIQDFGLLKAKFGQTGSGLGRADINQDGVVNIQDFGLLKAKFGQTLP